MSKLTALLVVGMIAVSGSMCAMEDESKERSNIGAMTFSVGGVQREMQKRTEARQAVQKIQPDAPAKAVETSSAGAPKQDLTVEVQQEMAGGAQAESPTARLDRLVPYENFDESDFVVNYQNALYCALFNEKGKEKNLYVSDKNTLGALKKQIEEAISETVYQKLNTLPEASAVNFAALCGNDATYKALFSKESSETLLAFMKKMEFPGLKGKIEIMSKENLAHIIACRDMLNKHSHFREQRRDRRAPVNLGGVILDLKGS